MCAEEGAIYSILDFTLDWPHAIDLTDPELATLSIRIAEATHRTGFSTSIPEQFVDEKDRGVVLRGEVGPG